MNWFKAFFQRLRDNADDKTPPKFILRFDDWCDDWFWVIKAFLCGRLLYKKEYLPENFSRLLQTVPLRRIKMLMRWWEIPTKEIEDAEEQVFALGGNNFRRSPLVLLALIQCLTENQRPEESAGSGYTYSLRTLGLPCIEMPPGYSMGPKRTQQDNSCPDAPAPPRFRRNEWKIARFQQRQRLPGSAKPRR